MGTYPMSVNNSMAVAGYYYASSTIVRGFVRQADGTFSTFEVAGSTYTEPESINDAGEVTGYYLALGGGMFPQLEPQGFLRYPNGRIVTFNPPCTFICNMSQPIAINAFGEIAGTYPFRDNGNPAAFVRSRNDSFTTSYPQVPVGGDVDDAVATGINGSGTIVGFYQPATGNHIDSFIVDARGYAISGIEIPAPGSDAPYTALESTIAEGINAQGVVVGWYAGCNQPCTNSPNPLTIGGFVRSPRGELTLFNPPGPLVTSPRPNFPNPTALPVFLEALSATAAPHRLSINEPGSVTGSYTDTAGVQHGFVRNPYGTITSFDPPRGHQTTATSINDDGVITGTFLWVGANQPPVGFLRVPVPQP